MAQQNYVLQEEEESSKKELGFPLEDLSDFGKVFGLASMSLQFGPPKPKTEIPSTKSKTISFLIASDISLNVKSKKIV